MKIWKPRERLTYIENCFVLSQDVAFISIQIEQCK